MTYPRLTDAERERIARLPLLARVQPENRERLLDTAHARVWRTGDRVVIEGEASDALYIVLDGSVRVTIRASERDVHLADLGPGEVFGEEGLLTGAPRSATVTALASLRCAVVPAPAFQAHLITAPGVRRGLERLSARRLQERLVRSVTALQGLELEGTRTADVFRKKFRAGDVIMREGAEPDGVFFLLRGAAVALRGNADEPTILARVGPGQCVGELGVLRREPRSASVVAETDVEALRVDADRFRAWVQDNPKLADYLGTLERVYPLAHGRNLSVYREEHEGREAVTTIAGDPAGDCVISTKISGEDIVLLSRGSAGLEDEQGRLRFEDPQGNRARELVLDRVERGWRGDIVRGRIAGVEVQSVGPDVARLYHGVRDREILDRRTLKRFQRTGYLGGEITPADPNCACNCLGIGRDAVAAALNEHGPDAEAVCAQLGLGVVCGACLPTVHEFIAGSSHATGSILQPSASVLVARRPEIEFDTDAIMKLSAEPGVHLAAVASIFAAVGERFMIQRVGQALPMLRSPDLVADVERFLEQESHHIAVHEPLNQLLLERVYPGSPSLRRASLRMVAGVELLPLPTALAVCAAIENFADCYFENFFEAYYDRGRRYSESPKAHVLLERSGLGQLFHWHGCEELSHRHVAFEVMRASGAGMISRWIAMGLLGLQALLLLAPAVLSLRRCSRGRERVAEPTLRTAGAGTSLGVILKSFRFLRPGFHPGRSQYRFQDQLEVEMERYPRA